MNDPPDSSCKLFRAHSRRFADNRYVYPVLSRRAGGISIGVNLNRDRTCNFNCIYCQVDRTDSLRPERFDRELFRRELDEMIETVVSGRIYEAAPFDDTPAPLRRLNDIAISGDGEPTVCEHFEEALAVSVGLRLRHRLDDVKLVLITNASRLHRAPVRRALQVLDANNGEIWAKLDAGTEGYFHRVARTKVEFKRILDNLVEAARARPIVIQTLLMRIEGQAMPPEEQKAYCGRLREILAAGGRIKLVQLHTVARRPAGDYVAPLSNAELDAAADLVRRKTGLTVNSYYA